MTTRAVPPTRPATHPLPRTAESSRVARRRGACEAPDASDTAGGTVGALLRTWRDRRRLSQLALALEAGVSQRHLSFVELGRARPSRALVRRLADELTLAPRERNRLLLAAGYAPDAPERPLDDPALAAARAAVARVLAAHEPYPALAVDRHWTLLAANRAADAVLFAGAAEALRRPPSNVLRLTLHPDGLAPRIANYAAWRAAVLAYLGQQADATGDPALAALLDELRAYPPPAGRPSQGRLTAPSPMESEAVPGAAGVFIPLELATDGGVLSLLSTVTVFATPVDVTLAELVVESFFPADAFSAEWLRAARPGDAARPGGPAPRATPA